jgi:hypothetical protein
MKLDSIFLENNSEFAQALKSWALENNYDVQEYPDKNEEPDSGINGLVIFNENQTVDREDSEIRAIFDHNQKPVHKIDINGTLNFGSNGTNVRKFFLSVLILCFKIQIWKDTLTVSNNLKALL